MYIHRAIQAEIEASLKRTNVTAILGPRRVGKSSLIKNYSKSVKNGIWCTINLDQLSIRERISNQELLQIVVENARQNIGGKEKIWVAIDEAQKSPELFDQIKLIYDEWIDKDKIKFILTGSGHLTLHKLSTESLAGRIELYYMQPFTLRELGAVQIDELNTNSILKCLTDKNSKELPNILQEEVNSLLPYKHILMNSLHESLIWGGFPELTKYSANSDKKRYLSNYIDTYLEQDIRAINTISDLNLFKNMMRVIAQQTGSLRDDNKICQALSCHVDTLKKYRGYLYATLLYIELHPFIEAMLKKLVKSPKAYMLDNGLITSLTGLDDYGILEATGKVGNRFENWFIQELRSWLAGESDRSEINFLRLSSGTEVDFIVSIRGNIFPFETTYGENPERRKVANLKRFMEYTPEVRWAFYIYNGKYMVDEANRIIFLPAWSI